MLGNIDHFMYAAPCLKAASKEFEMLTGVAATSGGEHPSLGTKNCLVGSDTSVYMELIGPNPSSTVASEMRSGLEALLRPQLHRFIMRCTSADFPALSQAYRDANVETSIHDLQRLTPCGQTLRWKLMIPKTNPNALFTPFFIDWLDTPHPSLNLPPTIKILSCEAGHPEAEGLTCLWQALGIRIPMRIADVPYVRLLLDTPNGEVALTSGAL